ncbi:hypothetical protein IJ670_04085 [bacterium]|nr:hypothetical protein [bacterium]
MKKRIIIYVFLFLFSFRAFALNAPNATFSGYCSSISGFNFLTRQIIEHKIETAFKKETNSKFNVKIKTFFGVNVLSGYFSSLHAHSSKIQNEKIKISYFDIKSINPVNKVDINGDSVVVSEKIPLSFLTEISTDDINYMLKNNTPSNIAGLKIVDTTAKIENDKLKLFYSALAFNLPIRLNLSAKLKVQNNRIMLCDIGFISKNKFTERFLNSLLTWSFKADSDKHYKLIFDSVKIIDNKVVVNGKIILPKGVLL